MCSSKSNLHDKFQNKLSSVFAANFPLLKVNNHNLLYYEESNYINNDKNGTKFIHNEKMSFKLYILIGF